MSGATDLAAIRAALVAALAAVPGIGVVHDHERYAPDNSRLAALYVPTGEQQLRGWFVRRVRSRETQVSGRHAITHTWQIRGFMALGDSDTPGAASELAFDGLIEAVRDRLRDHADLGPASLWPDGHDEAPEIGPQLIDSGPVLFAGVLCHACRLHLTTTHYL